MADNKKVSRRAVVAGSAVAAAAAPSAASAFSVVDLWRLLFGGAPKARTGPGSAAIVRKSALAAGTTDMWKAAIGADFTMKAESGNAVLRLASVEPLVDGPWRPATLARSQGFALKFDPVGGALPAGDKTYTLSNGKHGQLDVFFGSTSANPVAIFN